MVLRYRKENRNKKIVELHEKGLSFGDLAHKFKLNKKTVWEIYQGNKKLYGQEQEKKTRTKTRSKK